MRTLDLSLSLHPLPLPDRAPSPVCHRVAAPPRPTNRPTDRPPPAYLPRTPLVHRFRHLGPPHTATHRDRPQLRLNPRSQPRRGLSGSRTGARRIRSIGIQRRQHASTASERHTAQETFEFGLRALHEGFKTIVRQVLDENGDLKHKVTALTSRDTNINT